MQQYTLVRAKMINKRLALLFKSTQNGSDTPASLISVSEDPNVNHKENIIMTDDYPYPLLDTNGYEFPIIEQDQAEDYPFPLALPSDEERFNVKKGDLVKLIFQYKEFFGNIEDECKAERMWVEIIKLNDGYIEGRLDNKPGNETVLKEDQIVKFHPFHIIQIDG